MTSKIDKEKINELSMKFVDLLRPQELTHEQIYYIIFNIKICCDYAVFCQEKDTIKIDKFNKFIYKNSEKRFKKFKIGL